MPTVEVPSASSPAKDDVSPNSKPPSPTAPPYSPITPTMSASTTTTGSAATGHHPYPHAPPIESHNAVAHAENPRQAPIASIPSQEPGLQPPPPPQPISMSDNPDAIALRAAMSILQIQRQQALRDMKTLETQKEKALEDPETFARSVSEGKIKARGMEGIIPTRDDQAGTEEDDGMSGSENEMGSLGGGDGGRSVSFGDIPSAQNVVRMPPVNWAKYHVVGESLDRLHDEQRARPSSGYPLRDEELRPRERAPESVVAAPYNPWVDKVGDKPARTRNGAKKKN